MSCNPGNQFPSPQSRAWRDRQARYFLERDTNGNAGTIGIPAVVQVISAIVVGYVNVVGLVPVVSPVIWIGIKDAEPIATVLEARKTAHYHEGHAVDAERVILAIVAAVIRVWNAVAVVAAALLPGAVLR